MASLANPISNNLSGVIKSSKTQAPSTANFRSIRIIALRTNVFTRTFFTFTETKQAPAIAVQVGGVIKSFFTNAPDKTMNFRVAIKTALAFQTLSAIFTVAMTGKARSSSLQSSRVVIFFFAKTAEG
jgi:hypothetical protein